MAKPKTYMKYYIVSILLILSIELFSQSVDVNIPPDSLIKRYQVKTITTFYSKDSNKEELDNIFVFDSNGKLISRQIFDIEDSIYELDMYFYHASILKEYWEIGTRFKNDTLKTTYIYDSYNKVSKELNRVKSLGIDYTVTYTYVNDSITLKKYKGKSNNDRLYGIDSLIYNPDKSLKDLFNDSQDLKISFEYNQFKQIISESYYLISSSTFSFRYKKYFYEKGRLVKVIIGSPRFDVNRKDLVFEYSYFYNDNGLINKKETPGSVTTYKYIYFK